MVELGIGVKVAMLSVLAVLLTGITYAIATAIRLFSPIKFQSGMSILLAFLFLWNLLIARILLPALAVFYCGTKMLDERLSSTCNTSSLSDY